MREDGDVSKLVRGPFAAAPRRDTTMTQNLTHATQPATRDQQIRQVITKNVQGKNRLTSEHLSSSRKFFRSSRNRNRFHRVPSLIGMNERRLVVRVCLRASYEVGQCTTELPRSTRQKLPGALKFPPERGSCCIMHQTIPAVGR